MVEIRRTTALVETKLSSLITRIVKVEKRVEHLEMTGQDWSANPPARRRTDMGQTRRHGDSTVLNKL